MWTRFFLLFIIAICALPSVAYAQVASSNAVNRNGAPRYRSHTFTIADAACPTGTPGTAADGALYGMSLEGLRGIKITVCPASGKIITGAGKLKVCTFSASPWGPNKWALSPELTWDFADTSTDYTSTTDNPCIELSQLLPVVALGDRIFVYPSTDFGSDGTTLTVYLVGETR